MKATLKKIILILSMLTMNIWSVSAYSSNIDIGYNEGFALEATFSITDYVYIHTNSVGDMQSYGAGVGFKNNYFTGTLIVDNVDRLGSNSLKTTAKILYNDRVFSYFISVNYEGGTGMGYGFGVGYGLTEKLSLVTNYSNKGLFFGVRRWL